MSRQEELTKQRHFMIRKASINLEDIIPRGFTYNKISKDMNYSELKKRNRPIQNQSKVFVVVLFLICA